MKKRKWKVYAFFIILTEAVGILSALLTRGGMQAFDDVVQPALTPPDIVFPIVWTILYALMGIGAARIWLTKPSLWRRVSLVLFGIQLIVNFFWSIIFFNLQAFGFAMVWLVFLWMLIFLMILAYRNTDRIAAWLQLPYFIWVGLAGYLNFAVWVLNG